jgi:hypothetical protein
VASERVEIEEAAARTIELRPSRGARTATLVIHSASTGARFAAWVAVDGILTAAR